MGYKEGLAAIQEEMEKQGDYPDRQKASWVAIKGGESVKITPLQEIDEGSPKFSAKNGLARLVLEHQHPTEFKRKAECTADEGSCYGCAQGWRQKKVLYLNVLEDNGTDKTVKLFSRALGKGSVAQEFINAAADEEYDHSISDKVWKFSRTGKTKDDTTYTLSVLPGKAGESKVNVEDFELWDLDQAPFHVDPEKQELYYTTGSLKGDAQPQEAAQKEPVSAGAVDVDW